MTTKNYRPTPTKAELKKEEKTPINKKSLPEEKEEISMQAKIEELSRGKEELSKKLEKLTNRNEELLKERENLGSRCDQLEEKLLLCSVNSGFVEFVKTNQVKRVESLEKQVEELKKTNETLRADIGKKNSNKKCQELQNTLNILQRSMDELKKEIEEREKTSRREREQLESQMKNQSLTFHAEKVGLLEEKEASHLLCEQKDKEIAEQKQLLINERARNDSSIGSHCSSNGEIKIPLVREVFEEAVNSLSELLTSFSSSYIGTDVCSFQKSKKNFHQKMIVSLFGEGLWKIVKKKEKRTEMRISSILTGKEGNEDEKKILETSLMSTIETTIYRFIEAEFQWMVQRSDEIQTCIKACAQHALLLATHMTLCEPKMGVIVPKFGKKETFNPEKHEDASGTHQMIVSFTKRPGLICTIDNRVVTRASVETVLKNLE